MHFGLTQFGNALKQCTSGVAAMEFALLLPFMAATYFGAVEVSLLVQTDRRVTNASSTMADLSARLEKIDICKVEDIFIATQQVLGRQEAAQMSMRLSSVATNTEGQIEVIWSQARNVDALNEGDVVSLDDGLMPETGALIVAELQYDYDGALGYILKDAVTLADVYYLRPRNSIEVEWLGPQTMPDNGCGRQDDDSPRWSDTSSGDRAHPSPREETGTSDPATGGSGGDHPAPHSPWSQ